MTGYDIPVWKMCYEAARELPEVFAPIDVIRKIKEKRPEVKENTIRAHVIALSPNHPSSKHYTSSHKLFYYLGNGRYRLLRPDEERSIPPAPSGERRKEYAWFADSLGKADKLFAQGMYKEAMRGYGEIVEKVLKKLYREYFPSLPFQYKEKVVNFEKETKKSTNKYTIGQWIGLFRSAGLLEYIERDKKRGFVFSTHAMLNTLNNLRNISTHPPKDIDYYINKETALFMQAAIKCILRELKD